MASRLILCLVLTLTAGKVHAGGIGRLLVLDLSSSGVDEAVAKNLSEILGSSVRAALPGIDVVGTSEIQSMLALEKQRDLVGCEDNLSCLAEIGGALGADHLVVGTVGKVGSLYLLNLKLLDSSQAKTVRHVSKEIKGDIELLVEATRQWGAHLVDPERSAPMGYLDIRGEGVVKVDGAEVGRPPLKHTVTPGRHEVVWVSDAGDVLTRRQVDAEAYLTATVGRQEVVQASAGVGALQITTEPSGAEIYMDDRTIGVSPTELPGLQPGLPYVIRAELDEYHDSVEKVTVAAGETRSLKLVLEPKPYTPEFYIDVGAGFDFGGMFGTIGSSGMANPGEDAAHLKVSSGFSAGLRAIWVLAEMHGLTLAYNFSKVKIETDCCPVLRGDATLHAVMIGYQAIFFPGAMLRPWVGAAIGFESGNLAAEDGSERRTGEGETFILAVPEAGLRIDLPYHLTATVQAQVGISRVLTEALAFVTVGATVGTHF